MSTVNRSKDFRYIYSNALKLQFNGTELMLGVGLRENLASTDDDFYEEVAVVLSASSAKLWGEMISRLVASAERASGIEIAIDEDRLEKFDEMLRESEAAAIKARK